MRKTDNELKSKYRGIKINGVRINEHRYVMEQIIGRKLTSNEIVHHIDGNKLNNNPDNLQLLTRKQHVQVHFKGVKRTAETLEKIREASKQRWNSSESDKYKRPVDAIDTQTGEVVRCYKSMMDARRDGFHSYCIGLCCAGKRKVHKGYRWKYHDN